MSDQLTPESDPQDVDAAIVRALDRASSVSGEYEFFDAIRAELSGLRELVAEGVTKDGPAAHLVETASWAFDYRVSFDDGQGHPQFKPWLLGDKPYPPLLRDVEAEVLEHWSRLADATSGPPAMARLQHLLFERRVGNGRDRTRAAAEGYIAAQALWTLRLDRVTLLRLALHVARATDQTDLIAAAITAMVELAQESLAQDEHEPGVVLMLTEVLAAQGRVLTPSRVTREKALSLLREVLIAFKRGGDIAFYGFEGTSTTKSERQANELLSSAEDALATCLGGEQGRE